MRDSVAAVTIGGDAISGFFISADGLLVTTSEAEAAKGTGVVVTFADGKICAARVVATDKYNGISLLKADVKDAKPVQLGSSADVKAGQFAMTIANVFNSVLTDEQVAFSVGVVSGLYRLIDNEDYDGNVIETDAAVNLGSDGGPLVDADGKVIGVMSRAYSRARFLGTAIPIDQLKLALDDLKAGKAVLSGYFGADYKNAVVTGVDTGSPAEKAGLKKGDKITEIDSILIKSDKDIVTALGDAPAGSTAVIGVERDGEESFVQVTLGKGIAGKEIHQPARPKPANPLQPLPFPGQLPPPPKPQPKIEGDTPFLGITLEEKDGALWIKAVAPGSPAAAAIVMTGHKLTAVDGKAVKTLAEFEAIFKTLRPGQEVKISTENADGFKRQSTVTLGGRKGRLPQAQY